MHFPKFSALLGAIFLFTNLIGSTSPGQLLALKLAENPDSGIMKNVEIQNNFIPEIQVQEIVHTKTTEIPMFEESIEPADIFISEQTNINIKETYIHGGMSIKNNTEYIVDVTEFLSIGPQIKLTANNPQILIMHTHGSEAYTPAGLDRYEESDDKRTEDTEFNVIRIGAELTKLLEEQGLNVIHDTRIHDYPSYTGSYSRAEQAIKEILDQNPSITIVLDLHRDALDSNGIIYKTMADESGVCASQIMFLCGSDASGLQHDNWQKNLRLALYLQQTINTKHPTLMRPVTLVQERYNTHLTEGSIIVEVGSSGNTLQEALAAIRLFADAIGPALISLIE